MFYHYRVSVVIPALNEAQSIEGIVTRLRTMMHQSNSLVDAIVVCDNGSGDGTAEKALNSGATVVNESYKGYGAACLKAIMLLEQLDNTDIILFIDADQSVALNEIADLLNPFQQSTDVDLVIGSRTLHPSFKALPDTAMSWSQKMGNKVASIMIKWLYGYSVSDLGPFRAIKMQSYQRLHMCDKRFGWTVEMQVKTIQLGMNMVEVPVSCLPREGQSKISGTVSGVIGAAIGIIGTILKLYFNTENRKPRQLS